MITLNIRHKTTYRYRSPITLTQYQLMLRPRDSHVHRLISSTIAISPQATISWAHDVFSNSVAMVNFQEKTDILIIDSAAELQTYAAISPVFDIADTATAYPFQYSEDEWKDLGAFLIPQYADPTGRLLDWARGFVRAQPTDTLALLQDINDGISSWIFYQTRDEEGTQTPIETLNRGWGTCRDMATLFIEAVRTLGFGARIVSGYLYNPNGLIGLGSTHAWAEVYIPGAGWIDFDPTNRSVGNFTLIPVAFARDIQQIMPVVGHYIGESDSFLDMSVEVSVTS